MAERKEKLPLLMDVLTDVEAATLVQTSASPGFQVIVKIIEAACARAAEYPLKLDPEEEGYERKLTARTQRARNINEFAAEVRDAINFHVKVFNQQAVDQEVEAVDAVAKTFGIHKVPPKKAQK